jgi:hypothetical protein
MLSKVKGILSQNKGNVGNKLAEYSGDVLDSSLTPSVLESQTEYVYHVVDDVDCLGRLIPERFYPEFSDVDDSLKAQKYLGISESDFYDFCKKTLTESLDGENSSVSEITDASVFIGYPISDLGVELDPEKAADLFLAFIGENDVSSFLDDLLISLYPDGVLGKDDEVISEVVTGVMSSDMAAKFIEDLVNGALSLPESSVQRLDSLSRLAESTLEMGINTSFWVDLLIAGGLVLPEGSDKTVKSSVHAFDDSLKAAFNESMGISKVRVAKNPFHSIATKKGVEKILGSPPVSVQLRWSEFVKGVPMKVTAYIYPKDPKSRKYGEKLKAISPENVSIVENNNADFFTNKSILK